MDLIRKYFPGIAPGQLQKFEQLLPLYTEWNGQINVISRKDMEHFYERHVLHSLGIAKVMQFRPGTRVLDVGTGGGFPGIPLAILFPESRFVLVDSIGKKIKVVNEISRALDLRNVMALQQRAEVVNEKFDFVVSRAVTAMPEFLQWMDNRFLPTSANDLPNGILYLKGGDLNDELRLVKRQVRLYELSHYFDEPFFETKKVVFVRMV